MHFKLWRNLIQILTFRKDLIKTIKPFLENLSNRNNNENYQIFDIKFIPFLKTLSKVELALLNSFEIINFNDEKYISLMPKKELTTTNREQLINSETQKISELIKEDQLDEVQRFIRENSIQKLNPIKSSFNEIENISIPIIHCCIIEKAINCFKFLLINGIEDPTQTMKEQSPIYFYDIKHQQYIVIKQYEWDCMAIGIYYGELEIVKILEENGIEIGKNPFHIEAAFLSYRNSIAKEIIRKMKENEENEKMINEILYMGLIASAKSNNIKGIEILINYGMKINLKIENSEISIISSLGSQTPIFYAVFYNSKEIVEILLSKGANIHEKSIFFSKYKNTLIN